MHQSLKKPWGKSNLQLFVFARIVSAPVLLLFLFILGLIYLVIMIYGSFKLEKLFEYFCSSSGAFSSSISSEKIVLWISKLTSFGNLVFFFIQIIF